MPPVPETYAGKVTKTDFINVAVELNAKVSAVSPLTLIAGAATAKPLIIKGAASQSANLQEWQDSAGTVLAKIGADGTTTIIGGSNSGESLHTRAGSAATRGLVVRGASSQTANLQEWQNSAGTVLARIAPNGGLAVLDPGAPNLFGTSTSYGAILNITPGSTYPGIIIRGTASQTANLAEFQNSSGTAIVQFNIADGATVQRIISPSAGAIPLRLQGAASQSSNLFEALNSGGTVLAGFTAGGDPFVSTTTVTSAVAGAANALPSNPIGYVRFMVNGTVRVIPYYQHP